MATRSNEAGGSPARACGKHQSHGKRRVCSIPAGVNNTDFGKQPGDAVSENHSDHNCRHKQLATLQYRD
jgi:hypothetical protein